jgi:hypothetical protein
MTAYVAQGDGCREVSSPLAAANWCARLNWTASWENFDPEDVRPPERPSEARTPRVDWDEARRRLGQYGGR